ncbi:MAG: hypothetical protein COC24_017515 [Alphaproteobacteria bacterium]|nr:hypothetical protein [Alphaproteobacteria bacterium]
MAVNFQSETKTGTRYEVLRLSRFGGQIAASQLVHFLIVLTDIVMMAHLGGISLAAGLLINSFYIVIYVTTFGLMQGMLPQASRAIAIGDNVVFSNTVRVGLRISLGAAIILVIIIAFFGTRLDVFGYPEEYVQESFYYTIYILPGYFFSIILIGLRNILITVGRSQYFAIIAFLAAVLNVVLNDILAFGDLGFPAMGLAGIGMATSIVDLLLLVVFYIYAKHAMPRLNSIRSTQNWADFKAILRIGIPTASIFFVETTLFSGVLFIVGRSNIDFLIALGLIFQYETMAVMIPIGLSQAVVQRSAVAAANAQNLPKMLPTIIRASLLLTIIYLVVLAVIQFGMGVNFPELLVVGMTLNEDIQILLDKNQIYAFVIIGCHAMVIVIAGILRGLEDVRSSMLTVIACYWGAGLLLAFVVIEIFGYNVNLSVKIVAFALILSLISILIKLKSSLRQWKINHGGALSD